jgi:CRISPR/Cas system-associated exonuclease Cas4 (RecB family)
MNLFEECNLKYKFKYHDSIPIKEEKEYFLYGKVIHKFAEEYVLSKGQISVGKLLKDILEGEIPLERKDDKKNKINLTTEYINRLTNEVKNVCKITKNLGFDGHVEWPFDYDLDYPENKKIIGYIDRLIPIKNNKGYLILDYKTTKPSAWRKDETNIKQDMQLKIYARIVQKTLNIDPANIAAALYYVMDNKLVGVPRFYKNDLEETENILLNSYNEIKNLNPELVGPTTGFHCKRCEYKDICPYSNLKS